MLRTVAVSVATLLMLSSSIALASDALTPIGRKKSDDNFGMDYRTDFSDRKLEAGIDGGGVMLYGATTKAFTPGVAVTPYLDVSFGDGNSVVFQVPMGGHYINSDNAGYYFFRSPITDAASAEGQMGYVNPTIAFRYEFDLSPNLNKRGRVFLWTGMGMGVGIVASEAELTYADDTGNNLPEPAKTTYEDTRKNFFTLSPAGGARFRLTEFFFVNLTVRYTLFMNFNTDDVPNEGDIAGMQALEGGLGLSYEFGG